MCYRQVIRRSPTTRPVRATFGSDDVGVVGVQARDLFAAQTLEKIARVTDAIAKIDGVERVLSITNAVDPAADVFDPPRLLPHIPPRPGEIAALKKKLQYHAAVRQEPGCRRFQRRGDQRLLPESHRQAVPRSAHRRPDPARSSIEEHGSFSYTGAAHVKQAAVELMRHDLRRFTPIALALVLIVLWLSFRTVRGVVLPLLSVLLALVWTLGVMVLAGKSITLGTFILPPLLVVIGSSYGIHVMARYYEQVYSAARARASSSCAHSNACGCRCSCRH